MSPKPYAPPTKMKQALVKYTHNLYHFRNIELQYLYQTISGLF